MAKDSKPQEKSGDGLERGITLILQIGFAVLIFLLIVYFIQRVPDNTAVYKSGNDWGVVHFGGDGQ
ncbi:MAG: hypothetical protein M0Z52_07265 [Actinomycetota bacterium]|nr:hypothetical protein [Actinomycetota bacterium]